MNENTERREPVDLSKRAFRIKISTFKQEYAHSLPENLFLRKIEWQILGGLTFAEYLPEGKRIGMFFTLMRKLAKQADVYMPNLLWVLKQEYGKGVDIAHFHFLAAGLPQPAECSKLCHHLQSIWKQIGGGVSKILPYDSALSGRDYILKRSGAKSGNVRELSDKFEDTCGLMLSDSTKHYLSRR